jgi:2-methylisocitrate lyase-like PEP mutase family enzyme
MNVNGVIQEKAMRFHKLHHSKKMLMLPNIWDPLGALLLQNADFPAIATASAAVAYTHGFHDGEKISLEENLSLLSRIAGSVNVPVTADFESGFAATEGALYGNTRRLIETGIVGINLEDTNRQTGKLYTAEEQCRRLKAVRAAAIESGVNLFINARTDVLIHGKTDEQKQIGAVLERGAAYKEAGADGFYPILMKTNAGIEKTVKLGLPVNILTVPGIPSLKELSAMGVARVSLGPGFLKIALRSMKQLALKLKEGDGLEEITGNEVTSDYLRELINTNPK